DEHGGALDLLDVADVVSREVRDRVRAVVRAVGRSGDRDGGSDGVRVPVDAVFRHIDARAGVGRGQVHGNVGGLPTRRRVVCRRGLRVVDRVADRRGGRGVAGVVGDDGVQLETAVGQGGRVQ